MGGKSGSYDELVKKETPKIQQLATDYTRRARTLS